VEAIGLDPCPHCEVEQVADARFCSSCGKALPTGWEEPRSFTHDEGSTLGVGAELREALLGLEVPSGCARRFFGVMFGLGLLGAVSWSIALGHPVVQQVFPPILLGIAWVEVIGKFCLWVWSRTQPYAASLTGFIFYLTGAVFSWFSSLSMLEAVPLFAVVIQAVVQAGFLWVAFKVVQSSRNPLGRSKLSMPLAVQPVVLEPTPTPAPVLEELASRERAQTEAVLAVSTPAEVKIHEEQTGGWRSLGARAASVLVSLKQRSIELIRTSDDWLPSWLQPLPLRIFQAVIIAVVIYELNRAATVFTGPRGRLYPFRFAMVLAPVVALADLVIGAIVSFRLIKGLAKLFGDPVVDRDYWLKYLPRIAVMLSGLALLRIMSILAAPFTEHARFGSPNGSFFVALVLDVGLVVLCHVGRRFWKQSDLKIGAGPVDL